MLRDRPASGVPGVATQPGLMPKMAELGGAGYTRIDGSAAGSSPLREELAAARQK
eukprot:COSAG04_NODE_21138_length_379_cov_0.907143_1_plen_54_part_01